MKLENQVCSLEPSQKLEKLGVKQKGLFKWMKWSLNKKPKLIFNPDNDLLCLSGKLEYSISAFTVAELGEMLPKSIATKKYLGNLLLYYNERWAVGYGCKKLFPIFSDKTEANVRAKMLIYLLENKLITI